MLHVYLLTLLYNLWLFLEHVEFMKTVSEGHIIEFDTTLYVRLIRELNGGPIPRIHCIFAI